MWFLLIQIFLLLLLAAMFGALVAYWWLKRNYEDVTEAHTQLLRKSGVATGDLENNNLEARLAPLSNTLSGVAQKLAPVDQALRALNEKVDHLKDAQEGNVSMKLSALAASVEKNRGPDLQPMEARLRLLEQSVRAARAPDMDFTAIEQSLYRLEKTLGGLRMPEPDLQPVHMQIRMLEKMLTDLGAGLRGGAEKDYTQLTAGLNAISAKLNAMRMPDLAPVQEKIQTMERTLTTMRTPEPDLTPVINSVSRLDGRLDFGALENRLTAIEYGLAAVHDMLRTHPNAQGANGRAAARTSLHDETAPYAFSSAPVRPSRAADPINAMRRIGDQANLLQRPAFGDADDLTQIEGVGPILVKLLHETGVYYFWQMAEWTDEEAAYVDARLKHFQGRITRDNWVAQARLLAALPASARRPAASAD